eukprot:6285534-Amphidinium_carterae.2
MYFSDGGFRNPSWELRWLPDADRCLDARQLREECFPLMVLGAELWSFVNRMCEVALEKAFGLVEMLTIVRTPKNTPKNKMPPKNEVKQMEKKEK